MQNFMETLTSESKSEKLPEEFDFFGKLIGSWNIDEARKQDDIIVLTNIEDERRKWVFAKIEENHFHWQDVAVTEDGGWHVKFDLFAQRIE